MRTKKIGFAPPLLFAVLQCSSAMAAENGNISWPIGVNTVLNGVATQPGENRLYNYTLYYRADTLKDSNGHTSAVPVGADIFVNALRIDHGWERTWGNTHLASGFVLPVADISLRIAGQKSTTTAVGNLSFKPLIIGTHNDSSLLLMAAQLWLDLDTRSSVRDRRNHLRCRQQPQPRDRLPLGLDYALRATGRLLNQ